MVPNLTLIFCLITLAVCLVLPVVVILVLSLKNKGKKMPSAWLLGAAGFFVTQMVIRLPILTALQSQPWFVSFSESNGFLFAFMLAFTAGLFELAGRFVVAKLMSKNMTYKRSLAAGLGHGGIEAMLLIGLTYINNIAYIVMINCGAFDTVVAQAAQTGVDVSALWQIKDQLLTTSPALFLLAGFERILAMTGHVAMSLLVCYGVATGKPLKSALVCLGIHTLMDLTAGISLLIGKGLSQTAAYVIIYAILIVMAVLSIFVIRNIRRRWQETEDYYV